MKLEGHTILITGGSSGIGLELAKELRRRGNTLVITGRDQARLDAALRAVPGLQAIRSDVSRIEDIDALHQEVRQRFPRLDMLVNNAGVTRKTNLNRDPGSLEDFTTEIDVNLTGPIRLIQRFLPLLKQQPAAAVVNVTSGLAFVPLPISPIYCATKAAMHSFSLSLRTQLARTHVKVFEIAPPATQTHLLGVFESSDWEGIDIMDVQEMVRRSLKAMEADRYEILPGQSNQLKLMNRLAPAFIHSQLSKPVARMLAPES
jgi:uncharacterized oxidoreductase